MQLLYTKDHAGKCEGYKEERDTGSSLRDFFFFFYSIKGNRYIHIYSVIHMLIVYSFSVMLCGNTKMKKISPLLEGETVRKVSNLHDKGF